MKPSVDPAAALRELRALVGTYLEGSDDAPRAAELLDALERHQQAVRAIGTSHATVPTLGSLKKRSVGIPYARQQLDPATKTWFVTCPICSARICWSARTPSRSRARSTKRTSPRSTQMRKPCAACKEIAASGLSYQEHTCADGSPIVAAIGLGRCSECKALRGDPCRAPSGRTRMPHPGRRSVAS